MASPHEDVVADRLEFALWRRLFAYARAHPRLLYPLMTAAVVCAAGDAAFGFLTMRVIDAVTLHEGRGLATYAWLYLAASLLVCGGAWVFITQAGALGARMAHDIRRDAFRRLNELEFGWFDQRPVGWILARLTSDCDRLAEILAWGFNDLLWGLLLVIAIAGVLLALDPSLAALVLAVVPFIVGVSWVYQRKILVTARETRRWNSQITAAYSEGIGGVRTTRTLNREPAELQQFRGLTGKMYDASYRNARLAAAYQPIVLTLGAAAAGLALWQGTGEVRAGTLTLGTLVAFMSYAGQFFAPIQQIARVLANMQGAQAAAERVLGLLATEPSIRDRPEVQRAVAAARAAGQPEGPPGIDRLEFREVDFAYGSGPPVLSRFNLEVRAGQRIALVGPSGGGKSTIVSLVCRFYEPTKGSILLDGVDYRDRPLHWLQSRLGIVLQQPHLFSGTVRDNIRYGRLSATDAEVEEAARLVCAHEFIARLEKGYETEVGEGGSRLSSGQKQLVSFARALLARPAIFVMDEATSSVDTETEQAIQRGLQVVLSGRISFIIAHRLSTVRGADRILVIEGGRITESGTHAELIAARGHYHRLYTSQYRSESIEAVLAGAVTPQVRT